MSPLVMNRRTALGSIAAASIVASPFARAQEDYPSKGPIKVIVPLPAGGAADVTVRMLMDVLRRQLNQSIVIDNRPGGNFAIGMQAIARSAPDGYSLINVNTGMVSTQVSLKQYDLLKTLTPVSASATMPALLVVPANAPYKSARELVAWSLANPGKLNYGSVGLGSMEHLWSSSFMKSQGVSAMHIPYKGMPDASVALIAGDVHMLPLVYSVAQPFVQKGSIRALAVLDTQRHPGMPELPTLKEAGFDAPPLRFWGGFAAPAGTPAKIVEQLRQAIAVASQDASYVEKMLAIGGKPMTSETSQSFTDLIAEDLRWMSAAVKDANLTLN